MKSTDEQNPSKLNSVKIINSLLEYLSQAIKVDNKPMEIIYHDFVSAILTFAGMALSQSLFDNLIKEMKPHDLKNVATELTVAFRQTLEKSLGIAYEAHKNKEVH